MERHRPALMKRLMKMLGDPDGSADVFLETFARVWMHRDSFRFGARFRTWLHTIAVNLARSELRWRRRQPELISLEEIRQEEAETSTRPEFIEAVTPVQCVDEHEWEARLGNAIGALPPKLHHALSRFALDDRSVAEVAAEMGCTEKTVEMRLYRARRWLWASLEHGSRKIGGIPSARS